MKVFFKFYIFIYMIMSIGFTQEFTLTEEQVNNLFTQITECQNSDSLKTIELKLNTDYIKLLEFQQSELSLLNGDYKLKIENLDKQILLQQDRIKEISPKWYDNRWIWFTIGVLTTAGTVHLAGQLDN